MSLMFCTNCGHELSEGESVCPNCGAKIISDDYSIDEQLELLKEEPVVEEKVVEEVKVTEVPVVEENKVTVDEKEDKKKAKEEEKKRKKQEKEDAKNRKRQEKEEKKKKRQQEKEDRKNKKKQDKEDKKTEVPVVEEKKVEEKPKKVKKDPNLESGMVKTLKSILALVAIIALLTCTVLALILKFPCEMTSDEINYLEFIGENFKLLDGAKLSVNLVSLLIFNVVLPLCFIIILFIKQLIISIKIFTVGRNKNRTIIWRVISDCIVSFFIVRIISNSLSQNYGLDSNPLLFLIVPICFNLIFYATLYFIKLFKGEIGEFKFGSASTKGLMTHRIIQAINVVLVIVITCVATELLVDGVSVNFKPFSGIRGFVNDNLLNYGVMNELIPLNNIFNLLSVVCLFGSNLVVMMLEVSLIVAVINTIHRFVVRDELEEYYNKCFYKDINKNILKGLIQIVIYKVLYFVVTYIYLTMDKDAVLDITFVSCLYFIAPYFIGAFVTFVLGLVNNIFSKKWLSTIKENSED